MYNPKYPTSYNNIYVCYIPSHLYLLYFYFYLYLQLTLWNWSVAGIVYNTCNPAVYSKVERQRPLFDLV